MNFDSDRSAKKKTNAFDLSLISENEEEYESDISSSSTE
jgi:hypothetical protein